MKSKENNQINLDISFLLMKEYEILSEDRRRAVDMISKGTLIFLAVIGLGMKYLLEIDDREEIIIFGISGLSLILLSHWAIYHSKKLDKQISKRLNELSGIFRFNTIIPTNFVFIGIWGLLTIISIVWIVLFVKKIFY